MARPARRGPAVTSRRQQRPTGARRRRRPGSDMAALVIIATTSIVLAVNAVSGIPLSESATCHICGPAGAGANPGNGGSLFPGQPPPLPCQSEVGADARPCPPDYKGCLTSYNGTTLTRTCGEFAYQQCNKANGVVYCYCSGPLCNSQTGAQMEEHRRRLCRSRPRAPAAPRGPPGSDDEDDSEGSGDGIVPSQHLDAGDGDQLPLPDDGCWDVDGTTFETTSSSSPTTTATQRTSGIGTTSSSASGVTAAGSGPGSSSSSTDDLLFGSSSEDAAGAGTQDMATQATDSDTDNEIGGRGGSRRAHLSAWSALVALGAIMWAAALGSLPIGQGYIRAVN